MEWIDVKDRLPQNRDEILVNMGGRGLFMAIYTHNKEWALYYSDAGLQVTQYDQLSITHWMPLPPPPIK